MLAKVATVNSVKRNTPVVAAQKSFDIEREKEANLNDKKAQISFWNGVYVATVIQKEKLTKKAKKTKFKRDTGPNQIEKIFAEHSKELIRQKRLFDGESSLKLSWDCFMGLLILYSIVVIPFRIGFQVITTPQDDIFDRIVDCLFFIDILVSFNTAFVDPITEVVVTDRRKIAMNYFQIWFWIDFFSTITLDVLISAALGSHNQNLSSLRLIKIFRLSRMLKLLRVLKLSKIGMLIDSYNINPALVGVQKLVLQICFVAHIVACFWHFITTSDVKTNLIPADYNDPHANPDGRTWTVKFGFYDDPRGAVYVSAFYWTISTMLSIGYGDISGTNSVERMYCVATMLLGGVMFGAVIAQVTRLIESRNPQARAFKQRMDELKAYLNEKLLPSKLKTSAKDAYGYFLSHKSSFGESLIFGELPPNLLNKLVLSIYASDVVRISLFKICEESFIVHVITHCKPFQAMPGTKVLEKGDVADELVFIMRGIVQFTTVGYTEKDGVVDAVTGYSMEGGYFGDFEYQQRTLRLVTHRAMCNCNLMSIPTFALDEAILNNPITGSAINKELEERYQNFLSASKSFAHKKEGQRLYLKDKLVVDGSLKTAVADDDKNYLTALTTSVVSHEVFRALQEAPGRYGTRGVVEEMAEVREDEISSRFLILPRNSGKIKWDIFVGALILYSVIIIPVQIGFERQPNESLALFDHIVDSFFGLDMLLSLRTCYFDEETDAWVLIPQKIYMHYFRTWFMVDFFSIMPFETLLSGILSANLLSSLKLLKVVRLMRLLKLARLSKLRKYLGRLEDAIGINPASFELMSMLLEVVFIGHLTTCVYWFLSTNLSTYSWYDKLHLRDAPLKDQYITTLYWTFTTLSTVGYGDIVPVDTQGRIVATVVMILGGTVFGYIVANVSGLMSSMDVTATKVSDRIAEVSEYLVEKSASGPLAESILKHMRYMFTQSSAFDERAILSRLPLHISRRMIFFQHAETLSKIVIFKYIESKGVILYLFRILTPIFFDSLTYICIEGAMANEIVFLVSGRANVYKAKKLRVNRNARRRPAPPRGEHAVAIELCDLVSHISPGDFFGHMSMMNHRPHRASVRTFMPCSVYTLSDREISKLIRSFPAVAITLQNALALAINESRQSDQTEVRSQRAGFISKLQMKYVQRKTKATVSVTSSSNILDRVRTSLLRGESFDFRSSRHKGTPTNASASQVPSKESSSVETFDSSDSNVDQIGVSRRKYVTKTSQIAPIMECVNENRLSLVDVDGNEEEEKESTEPRQTAPQLSNSSKKLKNSKWQIVRAVVQDPSSMAIIENRLQQDSPEKPSQSVSTKNLPTKKLDVLRLSTVVQAQIQVKKKAKLAFLLNGREWYDSDEDRKIYDEFYLLKTRALFKSHRSCPNFSDLQFSQDFSTKRLSQSIRRRLSFPSYDVGSWTEGKLSNCGI